MRRAYLAALGGWSWILDSGSEAKAASALRPAAAVHGARDVSSVWWIRSARSERSAFSTAPDFRPRARALGLAGMATAETSRSSCSRYFREYALLSPPFSQRSGMNPTETALRNFPR